MLGRLKWMVAGAGLGVGGSWWAKRAARRAAASLRPARVGSRFARQARGRVRAAQVDARSARQATEDRLRRRVAPGEARSAASGHPRGRPVALPEDGPRAAASPTVA